MHIDFHVHSKYSKRPSQWVLQKIGCPESFTEPLQIYRTAKKKGMHRVTISDHNTIDGALEIAHLPDTFISEEITTYFPEDRCKVHVLAIDISERQHHEIQKVRNNIFDLVALLNQERIFHVLAHPLYDINDCLTLGHVEQFLLLFKNMELNGARNGDLNRRLQQIVEHLTPEVIARLQEKHGIVPSFETPWRKNLIGGSDDHSSLNIARTFTIIEGADSLSAALDGIRRGRARVANNVSTPQTLSHNLYGIAYQFFRDKFDFQRYVGKDLLLKFLNQSLVGEPQEENGFISKLYYLWRHRRQCKAKCPISDSLVAILEHETHHLIHDNPKFMEKIKPNDRDFAAPEKKWFDFVNQTSNRVMVHFADHMMNHLSGANVFNVFQSLGSAGGLYALLAPYFVSFSLFSKDQQFSRQVCEHFNVPYSSGASGESADAVKVAHFTDTFYDVNGVALSLQQQVQVAVRNNKNYSVITCDTENRAKKKGIQNFKPIGIYQLPEYPELKIFYPPLLEMLNFCYEEQFTLIQSATPGPIGLAALAVARILKLPINGTYHTALPQYAQILTGDESIGDLMWRFIVWYYDQMDFIYVPSLSTGQELVERGIASEKIRLFPRGIDIERFSPSKRNGFFEKKFCIPEKIKLLYVGRISKEKNLHLLAGVFKKIAAENSDVHLVVVGDGPYLAEMKQTLSGIPCTFTGYLEGEDLAAVYASSDIFIFPSTTDTFGNVVLEAQASGLPVIVTDSGGPQENTLPGKTGLVVRADDAVGLQQAVSKLIGNPSLVRQMGAAARRYMEERSFDGAFIKTWKMYKENKPAPKYRLVQGAEAAAGSRLTKI